MEKSKQQLGAEKSGLTPKLEEREIISCSGEDYWYKDMMGQTVKVKQYGSFGAWDEENRWYNFYDLS